MLKRKKRKQIITLNERLEIHEQKVRDNLATLPEGEQRDGLIQKVREI